MSDPAKKSINILVVEDNSPDVEIVRRALRVSKIAYQLKVINDGEEALLFLKEVESSADGNSVYQPQLIILDLNLPKFSGFEILKAVRFNKRINAAPVIMLTSSDDINDIKRSYKLGASSFITKPSSPEEFSGLVQKIETWWASVAKLH